MLKYKYGILCKLTKALYMDYTYKYIISSNEEREVIMMNDAEIIKAKIMFLGLVYFQSYGGFNRDQIVNKFKKEFKNLELKPFDGNIAGSADMDEPTIKLFAQLGRELNSFEFDTNIKYYRKVILHELIHKFLIKRDENGQVVGTGLFKMLDRDSEFSEYLRTSKVNKLMVLTNGIIMNLFHTGICEYEFGRGANEGYTEWFRKNILKNDEDISYQKLANIFDIIQKKLEKKNGNAIEKMKEFKEGDYNYIFNTLNMSKEVGILFIRTLDYMYVREYEKEMIEKYLEAKKLQKKLKRDEKKEELLNKIDDFCTEFENKVSQLKRFKKCKSEKDFYDELNKYVINSNEKEKREFETIKSILERADSNQERKLEITDIKDLQKDITSSIFGNENINGKKQFIGRINKKIKNTFGLKTNGEVIEQQNKKIVSMGTKKKPKLKKPSLENLNEKRFTVGENGRGLTELINGKLGDIACNMKFFVQKTFNNIKFAMEDISFEVGNVKDDIALEIQWYEKELKVIGIIAALAALGISTGFFVKHCIDKNIQSSSAIEQVINKGIKESKKLQIKENIISEEPHQQEKADDTIQKQEESFMWKIFKNGISLKKGDRVYRTSYQTKSDIAELDYDYNNLYCDLVRVIKGNEVIRDGKLENIEELYKIGIENNADVMLRTGVLNEDGTITYIAWCNLNEIIEKLEIITEKQSNGNKVILQEEYEETEI